MSEILKKHTIDELDRLYDEAETCDKALFSEQRSNLLLVSGDHYERSTKNIFRGIRDRKDLSDQQKIRLTKNHTQKIMGAYINHTLSAAPGVGFEPKNKKELQDQKAAELNESIWRDGADRQDMDSKVEDFAQDYYNIGEVVAKLSFHKTKGPIYGHMAQMNGEEPVLGQDGNPVANLAMPVRRGEIVIESIQGPNLLRAPHAKTIKDSPFLIHRKMAEIPDVKETFNVVDEDKLKQFAKSTDETFVVFDTQKGDYTESAKDQIMLREFYFRPCPRYRNGYVFITVKGLILFESELPSNDDGEPIFPIIFQPCEKISTSPRGRSKIKHIRPYQIEINRSASKMAEHQITLGDDKLILINGSSVSPGVGLPGVRTLSVSGEKPTVMPGRDGSQYLNYMTAQIEELYDIMSVKEIIDDTTGQSDVFALLFRSAAQKRKFGIYVKRFEKFLTQLAETYLEMARYYLPDDAIISAVGRDEIVNIQEFKSGPSNCYKIKIVPQSEDLETKMGQQLAIDHILQYVGGQLSPEDLGRLVSQMPFLNVKDGLSQLTVNYDIGTNMILSLDRGQQPMVSSYMPHDKIVTRLIDRMLKPDFQYLAPQIQQLYQIQLKIHEDAQAKQQQELLAAESEYIPTGGYMVNVEFYITDPQDGNKTKKAKVPYEALSWLIKKLEAQGSNQEVLGKMHQQSLVDISNMVSQGAMGGGGGGGQAPMPMSGQFSGQVAQ